MFTGLKILRENSYFKIFKNILWERIMKTTVCTALDHSGRRQWHPHSSTLAWKIPWMEEPGRLQSVHGVAKSRTWLSDFTFTFHFHALEKEMAAYFSVLAWRIPGKGEPGGLPSMGSHRVGHDWSNLAAAAEIIILSEVSQTERQTYDITYNMDSKKNDTNELIYKTEIDPQT